MLLGVIPLGVCFFLQWIVPPTDSQWGLFTYYVIITLLFYTAFTAVVLPHTALASELTQGYDERTTLISFKASFSIGSSILSLGLAQILFAYLQNPAERYRVLGAICGVIVIVAVFVCVWGTYRRYQLIQAQRAVLHRPRPEPLWQQIQIAFSTRPFLYVIGIYLCSWLGLQVTAAILPYFVTNWMKLPDHHVTQMALTVQGTALSMMFFWSYISRRLGKQRIYCLGIPLTIVGLVGLFFLQPDQLAMMYVLAAIAGFGLSTAYLVPWAMLPDVVDLDELNTGRRREGIFYGSGLTHCPRKTQGLDDFWGRSAPPKIVQLRKSCGFVVQLQKLSVAIAIFLVGRLLDWTNFVPATSANPALEQPLSALWAIRILIGPIPAVILLIGLILAHFYPITRDVHAGIVMKLWERREKMGLQDENL